MTLRISTRRMDASSFSHPVKNGSQVATTNSFDVVMSKVDDKKLKVSGATNLKMSDFKIDPPAPKIAASIRASQGGMLSTRDNLACRGQVVCAGGVGFDSFAGINNLCVKCVYLGGRN